MPDSFIQQREGTGLILGRNGNLSPKLAFCNFALGNDKQWLLWLLNSAMNKIKCSNLRPLVPHLMKINIIMTKWSQWNWRLAVGGLHLDAPGAPENLYKDLRKIILSLPY